MCEINKAVALVYLVTNNINNKKYVGITKVSVGIEKRWKQHVYNATYGTTSWLSKAIAKYGKENFTVQHVANCLDKSNAHLVETDVILAFLPEYNQTSGGEFTAGIVKHSLAVCEKRAKSNRGKKRTPEMRQAMSIIKKKLHQENPAAREKLLRILKKHKLF